MHSLHTQTTFARTGIPPTSHRHRAHRSRPAFTLVELLVVIAIIGMLTAIAVPTIFGAVAAARNAKTKAEIDMLHMALMNYKNEYGSFPPANMGPTKAGGVGLWNFTNDTLNQTHPAYKHLVRIFPRLSEDRTAAGPYKAMALMSPAQSLVFWLSGFYENPEFPLTNGGTPGNRKRLFDFDQSRFYAVANDLNNPYTFYTVSTLPASPTRQTFQPLANGNAFQRSFPVYFTGHPTCGLPYVYFDSKAYNDEATKDDIVYPAQSINGDASTAAPYISSLPPVNPTWGQRHMASETFQIIAAGKDGSYGNTQAAFPGNANAPPPPNGYWSAGNNLNAPGHGDNITNFADRPLLNAIDALSSQ